MMRALNDCQIATVRLRRSAGALLSDIAREFDVSDETIRRACAGISGPPRSQCLSALSEFQRADARRRRRAGEKLESIALAFDVSDETIRRACAKVVRPVERHDHAAAFDLAERAAALFGMTLEQLQRAPGRGHPDAIFGHHHARAAAVAAMRVGERPIAWEVIAEVLAPGERFGRLNLQRVLRRARATAINDRREAA